MLGLLCLCLVVRDLGAEDAPSSKAIADANPQTVVASQWILTIRHVEDGLPKVPVNGGLTSISAEQGEEGLVIRGTLMPTSRNADFQIDLRDYKLLCGVTEKLPVTMDVTPKTGKNTFSVQWPGGKLDSLSKDDFPARVTAVYVTPKSAKKIFTLADSRPTNLHPGGTMPQVENTSIVGCGTLRQEINRLAPTSTSATPAGVKQTVTMTPEGIHDPHAASQGARQARFGILGEKGAIDEVYKVEDPLFWPRTVGAKAVLDYGKSGKGHGPYMTVELIQEDVIEIRFLQDFTHDLTQEDGLIEGKVQRTIHAGVALRVDKKPEAFRRILSLKGPPDAYSVLSDTAKLTLSRGVADLRKGVYPENEVCNLRSQGSPDAVPRTAVLGVKGVCLSKDATLQDDGPGVAAGTELVILEERGLALRVRLPEGTTNWCRRAYVCTKEEMEVRKARNQVPDTVTFMGPGEERGYTLYGTMHIRNNKLALLPGQALWLDEKLCASKPELEWHGKRIRTRTDALFLVLEDGLLELPAWPSGRKAQEPGVGAPTTTLLPPFDVPLNGQNEVRVRNPNDFEVTAGLRAARAGVDFAVPANGINSIFVPDGRYDIYFVYSSKPDALFQGDSFTLRGNGVEIQIVKVVGGNYGIRRVK